MIETLPGAVALLKEIGIRVVAATTALTSGVVLFAPPSVLSDLGLTEFMADKRGFMGLLFLASLGTLAVLFLQMVSSHMTSERAGRASERSSKQDWLEVLIDLTPSEKAYLLPYIENQESTQYFSMSDGVAGGLVAKGILYQAANLGSMRYGFAYNLQPWARRQLTKNRKLLRGAGSPAPHPFDQLMGGWLGQITWG